MGAGTDSRIPHTKICRTSWVNAVHYNPESSTSTSELTFYHRLYPLRFTTVIADSSGPRAIAVRRKDSLHPSKVCVRLCLPEIPTCSLAFGTTSSSTISSSVDTASLSSRTLDE